MIVIMCIDNDLGLMFNHRRQSQDRTLREHILSITGEKLLWMNHYSKRQFNDCSSATINVSDEFLQEAGEDDYCFVESDDISLFDSKISKIFLYKWNRNYPSDVKMPIQLFKPKWNLVSSMDFPGYSHEKITEEVYERCN